MNRVIFGKKCCGIEMKYDLLVVDVRNHGINARNMVLWRVILTCNKLPLFVYSTAIQYMP